MQQAINLDEKLALVDDRRAPKIVTRYNTNDVMVPKFKGAFPFHSHADTDDFFLVLSGQMRMEFEDRGVEVGAGELLVVPKDVTHRPVADEECHVLLIEPTGEPNTGTSTERAAAEKTAI
ncbi:MAG: cupin domain-containing protein [Pseudomonadota bacterium]